jgi:hypothetical protein
MSTIPFAIGRTIQTRTDPVETKIIPAAAPRVIALTWALRSCVLATALCTTALALTAVEYLGVCRMIHPLFWVPIALAAFGVAGSTYMTVSARLR